MGCNHPYFFGCTLHIFNHVLLLTDDYSLQRLFRFHPFNSDTHSVFEHAHIPSVNTHSGKCKRTCLKKTSTGTQHTCCWEINCRTAACANPSGALGPLLTASKGLHPPVFPLCYQRHQKCIQSPTFAPPYDNAEVIIKVGWAVSFGMPRYPNEPGSWVELINTWVLHILQIRIILSAWHELFVTLIVFVTTGPFTCALVLIKGSHWSSSSCFSYQEMEAMLAMLVSKPPLPSLWPPMALCTLLIWATSGSELSAPTSLRLTQPD